MLSIKGATISVCMIVAFLTISFISGCTGMSASTDNPGGVGRDAASVMGGGSHDPADLVNEAWSLNA